MSYTNKPLIENYLQRALTSDEAASLITLNRAVKKWIDKKTTSSFDQATASIRRYDGGVSSLDIDPCTTITAVSALNDDGSVSYSYDLTSTPEVQFEPLNETIKRELRKRNGCFPDGTGRIAVTAQFSEYDAGVPEDIELIATRLLAAIIRGSSFDSNSAGIKKESIEGHSVEYSTSSDTLDTLATGDPIVRSVLEQHRELLVG